MLEVERSIDRTNETGRMIPVGQGINGAMQLVYQPSFLPVAFEFSAGGKGMFVYRVYSRWDRVMGKDGIEPSDEPFKTRTDSAPTFINFLYFVTRNGCGINVQFARNERLTFIRPGPFVLRKR
mgnify:CR=1 FL=1